MKRRLRRGKALHLLKQTELEMPPLVHELLQPIALLPTVKTVLYFFLL